MLKPIRLLSLFALLVLLSAAVSAQAAPLAVRVRVAHLAPFAGSSAAKLTVTLDGAPLAANLVCPACGGSSPRRPELSTKRRPAEGTAGRIQEADG